MVNLFFEQQIEEAIDRIKRFEKKELVLYEQFRKRYDSFHYSK